MRIVLATTNRHKLQEARSVLSGLGIEIASLDEFPSIEPPVEDAATFEGNARIKALYYAGVLGCWALADDSGLEVDALDGAPGVLSARFAGEGADDRANNAKLIAALTNVPDTRRTARYRCSVAFAGGERIIATAAGTLEGVILAAPRGSNGFGYDPYFWVPARAMTAAEMTTDQKNSISHRGAAFRAIREKIEFAAADGKI